MAERNSALPTFGARLQDVARRLGVAGFWAWWTRELDVLVPAAPRAAMARRRMRPVLVFEGEHALLWRPAMEGGRAVMVQSARIPLAGDAAAVAAAGQAAFAPMTRTRMAYGGAINPVRAVIALPARDVLRKHVVLPSAVEENFRQALAYDLDRHTPFKSDELYFDAAIIGRDAAHGTITIDLAAARKGVVDPARKYATSWGVDVVAIVPEPAATASTSRLNLLPRDARASSSPWARWQFWLPLALVVAAALAAAIIPVWQKRDYAIQMIQVVGQARAQAAVSEALRQELDARVGDFNAVLDRKYAYPSALAVVDTVSKLLPDDTWLTQFELKNVIKGKEAQRELLVRGESASAGKLVQLFEESLLFAQAAPRSPTTKIQPGTGEIFDLGAQLKPLGRPTPVPLMVVPTAAAGEAGPVSTTPPMPDGVQPVPPPAPPGAGNAPPATGQAPAAPAGAPPPAPPPALGKSAAGAPNGTPPPSPSRPANGVRPSPPGTAMPGVANSAIGAPAAPMPTPAATAPTRSAPAAQAPSAATATAGAAPSPTPPSAGSASAAAAVAAPAPAPGTARGDRGNGASPMGGGRP